MTLINKLILSVLATLALTSCARQISSDVYASRQVGEASLTYAGVIRNVRQVVVQQGEQLDNNELGMIGGGVAGGVLGNAVGRGNLLPTAIGAVAGAVTGSLVEKQLKQQMALEYVVELNNGDMITVVQGEDDCLPIGQPVYVMFSRCGRTRLVSQY